MTDRPVLMHTVVDALECRPLAEFYRELLGLRWRPGHEPPTDGSPDDADWLVLVDDAGRRVLAFQDVPAHKRPDWPDHEVPAQLHLDFRVDDVDALERHRRRAEELGAQVLLDRTYDAEEPLYVLADPMGHPFCLLVSPG